MRTEELTLEVLQYSSEVLDIIDNQDDFDRSDLQGAVEALVYKIMKKSREKTIMEFEELLKNIRNFKEEKVNSYSTGWNDCKDTALLDLKEFKETN